MRRLSIIGVHHAASVFSFLQEHAGEDNTSGQLVAHDLTGANGILLALFNSLRDYVPCCCRCARLNEDRHRRKVGINYDLSICLPCLVWLVPILWDGHGIGGVCLLRGLRCICHRVAFQSVPDASGTPASRLLQYSIPLYIVKRMHKEYVNSFRHAASHVLPGGQHLFSIC